MLIYVNNRHSIDSKSQKDTQKKVSLGSRENYCSMDVTILNERILLVINRRSNLCCSLMSFLTFCV